MNDNTFSTPPSDLPTASLSASRANHPPSSPTHLLVCRQFHASCYTPRHVRSAQAIYPRLFMVFFSPHCMGDAGIGCAASRLASDIASYNVVPRGPRRTGGSAAKRSGVAWEARGALWDGFSVGGNAGAAPRAGVGGQGWGFGGGFALLGWASSSRIIRWVGR
jgi:hypothetical protein